MNGDPVVGEKYHLKKSMQIEGVLPESAMVTIPPRATLTFREKWQYEKDEMWRFFWEETRQLLSLKERYARPLLKPA